MRRRGCSSCGCTSGAAAGLLVDEAGASPWAAAGLPVDVDGGVATPPYFDRVDTELVDVIEGPSLGEGGMPSLGESHSSGKRGASSSARGLGDLERVGTVRPTCAAWRRRRRSRRSVLSCRRAAATAVAIRSSTRASTEGHIPDGRGGGRSASPLELATTRRSGSSRGVVTQRDPPPRTSFILLCRIPRRGPGNVKRTRAARGFAPDSGVQFSRPRFRIR